MCIIWHSLLCHLTLLGRASHICAIDNIAILPINSGIIRQFRVLGHSQWGTVFMATITQLPIRQRHVPTIADELDNFLAYCRDRLNLAPNTLDAYRSDLVAAALVLDGPLGAITRNDVETYLAARQERAGTTNRRIVSLRRFFTWALGQGVCVSNPLTQIEAKGDDVHLPRPISNMTDLKALDSAIMAAPQPYRIMFTILRETGMRPDEVLSLDIGDVTLDPGREGLRIREAKNHTDRIVVLDADQMKRTLRLLRSWIRTLSDSIGPTTPLFRSNRGTRVSYDALHYQWGKICLAAKVVDAIDGKVQPRYTIHQLRHTVGTDLIRDLPEHIVSRMLGHRDPRSTRRYADVTESHVRAALAGRRRRL